MEISRLRKKKGKGGNLRNERKGKPYC